MQKHAIISSQALNIHASLVTVRGQGLLLRGPSGTGKSDVALELLRRGYRLVADDVVEVVERQGRPWGRSPTRIAGRLEVREVGVVEVGDLFGPKAMVAASAIDAVVDLLPPAATPPSRATAPLPPTPLCGVDLPTFVLHAADTTACANRLEVIAGLVSNRGQGPPDG